MVIGRQLGLVDEAGDRAAAGRQHRPNLAGQGAVADEEHARLRAEPGDGGSQVKRALRLPELPAEHDHRAPVVEAPPGEQRLADGGRGGEALIVDRVRSEEDPSRAVPLVELLVAVPDGEAARAAGHDRAGDGVTGRAADSAGLAPRPRVAAQQVRDAAAAAAGRGGEHPGVGMTVRHHRVVPAQPLRQPSYPGRQGAGQEFVLIPREQVDIPGDGHAEPRVEGRLEPVIAQVEDIEPDVRPRREPLVERGVVLDRVQVDHPQSRDAPPVAEGVHAPLPSIQSK